MSSIVSAESSLITSVLESNSSCNSPSFDSRPSSSASFKTPSALSFKQERLVSPSPSTPEPASPTYVEPEAEDSSTVERHEELPESAPSLELINNEGLNYFRGNLPKRWVAIADSCGFHLVLHSPVSPLSIQREIFISYNGNVSIYFHCTLVPSFEEIFRLSSATRIMYDSSSVQKFCQHGITLAKQFLLYNSCVGANDQETKKVRYMIQGAYHDTNPYHESNYQETCRSLACRRLVQLGHGVRCKECAKLAKLISQRKSFLLAPTADPSTSNEYLTREQAMNKLHEQTETIMKKNKQLAYYKVQRMLASEGVDIDAELSDQFTDILLSSNKLTDNQKMLLMEQWSQSNKSNSRNHIWHPSMIRLALHIYSTSPAGYRALRDSGALKLPCVRTLFDYSHAIKAKEGVHDELLSLVQEKVATYAEKYKEFHVLLCDGMHISQNLVYRKQDGVLVGYTHLDDVKEEVDRFEKFLEGKEQGQPDRVLATEILAFMVKGMASDVKCVIACYPCKVLTAEMMYKWSWDVIRACEIRNIKILAFVCDGLGVNRTFFEMHTPVTKDTHFKLVFDTINFCSPERRVLYFISDVCHLLKTLRNAFYNSGDGKKKPRLMTINGQTIQWKTIVRLYLTYKSDTLRKSYKLNSQNVFLTSYSKMKVRYAAHVLSKTVAIDLEKQGWKGIEETVKYILYCNKFFDVLNGAHSSQAGRTRNTDLAAFTSADDERFTWLKDVFLAHFVNWKKQVNAMPLTAQEKEKMLPPQPTMNGLEISIRGIEGATRYFLTVAKAKFVMARVYSQDPLEQFFGKQRMGGGGSRNPNSAQWQQKQVGDAISRGLDVRIRGGNSTECDAGHTISDEPLKKRKRLK